MFSKKDKPAVTALSDEEIQAELDRRNWLKYKADIDSFVDKAKDRKNSDMHITIRISDTDRSDSLGYNDIEIRKAFIQPSKRRAVLDMLETIWDGVVPDEP